MIDASALAIGRGANAANGLKTGGSQDEAGSQGQALGFGDFLEDAPSGSVGAETAGDEVAVDELGVGAMDAGDDKLARSIISLFAVVHASPKLTQQAANPAADLPVVQGEAAAPQLPQIGDVAPHTNSEPMSEPIPGQTLETDGTRLAALLVGADGAVTTGQKAAIADDLQVEGQIAAPSEEAIAPTLPEETPTLPEEADPIALVFDEPELTENHSVAHHLLSALSKGLREEGTDKDEAPNVEAASEAGDEPDPIITVNIGQAPTTVAVAKSVDVPAEVAPRGTDSVKDALAQVSAQPQQSKPVTSDPIRDEAFKQGATGDDLDFTGFDQLTVLDSRRYLGFGGDNAKMLTAALAGEAGRALAPYATMTDVAAQATATTVNTLKIQMNPENLGTMTALLRLKGEDLSIEVTVDTIEGYRHLSKDQSAIVQSLRDQGFSVDQVSIQLNPAPKTESQQQDQGQNGSNQNLREGQGDAQRQQSGDGRPVPRSERLGFGEQRVSQELDNGGGSGDSGDGLYL
jgi:flagellar hook-length control protein FliK